MPNVDAAQNNRNKLKLSTARGTRQREHFIHAANQIDRPKAVTLCLIAIDRYGASAPHDAAPAFRPMATRERLSLTT